MRALDRKLLREVWRLRGQMLSIALVVACGIMTVVMMRSTYESLEASRVAYYEEFHFADVFANVVRAPESIVTRLAEIEGVAAVESRITYEVNLDVPGLGEPATGRLISIPDRYPPLLNRLHLTAGRLPEAGRAEEVVTSTAFSLANGLVVGDAVGAVINGRWERLRIVGIGMSPEYVYEVSPGQIFPDSRRFGVLWMSRGALAPATAMEGSFNEVVAKLARGASEARVISEIDRLLEPFGALGAYGRDDQISHRILIDELRQNRSSGTMIPAIFLGVAAFLLHIVLSRLIRTQREQIAVLKAFGYSDLEIGRHYLRFALTAVVAGTLIGTALGIWIGRALLDLYGDFFQFPELIYQVSWPLVIGAIAVSAAAAAAGAVGAVRKAVALPPAEAMRPEAPAHFRRGVLERAGLGRLMSPAARMVVRTLERQPLRAAISSLAVGLAISILLVGSFMFDAVDFMADFQFRAVQREDVTVSFNTPRPAGVRHELGRMAGVTRVETFRTIPVRIRAGHRTRQVALTGLEEEAELRRILGVDLQRFDVPAEGVLISAKLADILDISTGDTIRLEALEGRRPVRSTRVAGVVDDLFGLNLYMEIGALNRLMREGPTVSGAHLAVENRERAALNDRLKEMPAVAGVSIRSTLLESFEEQTQQNLLVSMSILILFAGIIAVGVIYNGARISLSERARELASLRVLGFTRKEVAVILFGEQAAVTALGIPLGFGIGLIFAHLIITGFDNESYRIPLVMNDATFALAAGFAVVAASVAGLLVRRRLDRLDLIEVLKTRE